jgi:peptide/nickel transport system substrate-binding protein
MKRLFGVSLIILTIILVLGGCSNATPTSTSTSSQTQAPVSTLSQSSSTPTTTSTSAPALTPTSGGTLKFLATNGIVNVGYPGKPWGGADLSCQRFMVESLLDFDAKFNVIPWLATKWTIGTDNKSITLTLKQGVKFHDGTPFNAQAVKFCLDLAKPGRPDLGFLTSVAVVDDYNVQINLTQFVPKFLITLAGISGRMVSPTAIQTMGEQCMTHPVGTGPFKFESFQRDVNLKMTRNNDYWGPKPYLDGIEFDVIKDPVTELLAFKAGEAQVMDDVPPKDVADLIATGKYSVNKTPFTVNGLVGDSAHPDSPFADIKVRQAIAYAIDNAQIIKAVGYGILQPTNQFTDPAHFSYNPQVAGFPYDVQKAKDLLAQAGHSNGFTTKLAFSSMNPLDKDICTMIQGYLSKVGIIATLDSLDAGKWTELTTKGWNNELVALNVSHSNALDKADGLVNNLSQKSMFYPSSTVWTPEDYNVLLTKVVNEADLTKRPAMFQEIMKMITDQYCLAVPLYANYGAVVYTNQIHDFEFNVIAHHIYHPEKWWISK